ncbi:MAG: hypothetical protein ACOYI8_01085 [Christensenellales bacterium]
MEAAADAIKTPSRTEAKDIESEPVETFEEVVDENHFSFPQYKAADIPMLSRKYGSHDLKGMVKAILDVEAPLSEELLLKRIVPCFGREKVTNVVQRMYEERMRGYQRYDIVRRDGFLYLDKEIRFRIPGDITRDIRHIAPEELAAGMREILRQNVTADKSGLYRSLAAQCGVARVGKSVNAALDSALRALEGDVIIDGELISLK